MARRSVHTFGRSQPGVGDCRQIPSDPTPGLAEVDEVLLAGGVRRVGPCRNIDTPIACICLGCGHDVSPRKRGAPKYGPCWNGSASVHTGCADPTTWQAEVGDCCDTGGWLARGRVGEGGWWPPAMVTRLATSGASALPVWATTRSAAGTAPPHHHSVLAVRNLPDGHPSPPGDHPGHPALHQQGPHTVLRRRVAPI